MIDEPLAWPASEQMIGLALPDGRHDKMYGELTPDLARRLVADLEKALYAIQQEHGS